MQNNEATMQADIKSQMDSRGLTNSSNVIVAVLKKTKLEIRKKNHKKIKPLPKK